MNQTPATRVRWKVLAWLCSLSALTYITRIGIIQVQDRIELDLHLTPQRLAYAFSAFSLAYALFEMPSGWLGDKLGPRKVLIRIVLVWTAFTAFTGLAWGLVSLIVFRFLFGAGEAGAFPNISRASREWFPFSERGFTQGNGVDVRPLGRCGRASSDDAPGLPFRMARRVRADER